MLAKLSVDQVLKKARSHAKKGEITKAQKLYQAVLLVSPKNIRAQQGLTALNKPKKNNTSQSLPQETVDQLVKLYNQGQFLTVVEQAQALTEQYPETFIVWNILGASTAKIGKQDEAIEFYNKSIALKPDYAEAYGNMGNTLQEQGKLDEAIEAYNKAISLKPDYAEAYSNMGATLQELGKLDEAIGAYNKAISLKPDYAEAYSNIGVALKEQGKLDEAIEAYNKAISLKPDYAEAYSNLGAILEKFGQLEEAEVMHRKAIMLNPDSAHLHNNLAVTLKNLGRFEQAEASYTKAILLNSKYRRAYTNRNFCLNYSSLWSPLFIFQKHLEFEKQFGGLEVRTPLSLPVKKQPGDKLRVGYVSGDLNEHSVAYFFEPLLQHHNTNAIETFCYYNDKIIDEITDRLITTTNNWHSIFGVSDTDVVNLIKNDKIDILVDLSGHTGKNRLLVFAQKPAPIQVTWLGYPNTTGLSAIDYRLTDIIADPVGEADDLHSETLVRLPNGFQCYKGDQTVIADVNLPQKSNGYITFGSFNNLSKVSPEIIKLWSKILQSVPNSQLILKGSHLNHDTTRYIKLFNKEGISENQIKLYGRLPNKIDHLKLYNSIDIGLDPFHYNGATTTCEALWMGVPVITLLGDRHVGRVGASILTNVGLTDFIAQDIDDYVELAIKMAGNIEYLEKTRQGLRERMESSPLCNGKSFACNIENAYQDMWNKYIN